ncbi:hypothetical protein [Thermococcus chitonophagus]|nr:hypothetical protein [Thermococcus chitonophagus]
MGKLISFPIALIIVSDAPEYRLGIGEATYLRNVSAGNTVLACMDLFHTACISGKVITNLGDSLVLHSLGANQEVNIRKGNIKYVLVADFPMWVLGILLILLFVIVIREFPSVGSMIIVYTTLSLGILGAFYVPQWELKYEPPTPEFGGYKIIYNQSLLVFDVYITNSKLKMNIESVSCDVWEYKNVTSWVNGSKVFIKLPSDIFLEVYKESEERINKTSSTLITKGTLSFLVRCDMKLNHGNLKLKFPVSVVLEDLALRNINGTIILTNQNPIPIPVYVEFIKTNDISTKLICSKRVILPAFSSTQLYPSNGTKCNNADFIRINYVLWGLKRGKGVKVK